MSLVGDGTIWIFAIDTNLYSGNFEREMCCYVTGVFDDDSMAHGQPQQEIYLQEMGYSSEYDNPFHPENARGMAMPPSEYGARPCGIWSTPGFGNDGGGPKDSNLHHLRSKEEC